MRALPCPLRQCIPTSTLQSLTYAAWQKGADISLPASWAHPLLWRRGSSVAAPSGVPGWHNPPPYHLFLPVFLSFHLLLCFSFLILSGSHLHTCMHGQHPCPATAPPARAPTNTPSPCLPCHVSTGKYLLVRDPNKPQLCLYAIPAEGLDQAQYQGEGGSGAAADGEAEEE